MCFHATAIDGVVLASEDTELSFLVDFGDIVGGQFFGTDIRCMDDEGAFLAQADADVIERSVPLGSILAILSAKGNLREGFGHAVCTPYMVGEVLQFCSQSIVYCSTSDNQVIDFHELFSFFGHL